MKRYSFERLSSGYWKLRFRDTSDRGHINNDHIVVATVTRRLVFSSIAERRFATKFHSVPTLFSEKIVWFIVRRKIKEENDEEERG